RLHQLRYGHGELRDALVVGGLWCAFEDWAMGDAAEYIADRFGVSRPAMDEYALASHRKAVAAIEDGKFTAEIVPVAIQGSRGEAVLVERDGAPRRDTSLEAVVELPPAFTAGRRVAVGNLPRLD